MKETLLGEGRQARQQMRAAAIGRQLRTGGHVEAKVEARLRRDKCRTRWRACQEGCRRLRWKARHEQVEQEHVEEGPLSKGVEEEEESAAPGRVQHARRRPEREERERHLDVQTQHPLRVCVCVYSLTHPK